LKLEEKYINQLNAVRQDLNLLNNYRFDKEVSDLSHFARLRLNIAIYNDFKQTDFEIVKFLFEEENRWRKYDVPKAGKVDNLYFSAFLLTLFNIPEIIWLFFDSKSVDFDSGIGFDGEYLVSCGISKTYQYLKTVENPLKAKLLNYIGKTEANCSYSQDDIDLWKEDKELYFGIYKFPVEDEMFFLYSTNEKELFLDKLPGWIRQERKWTYEELSLYKTYAKYSGDKLLEIEAFKLTIEKNDKDFLTDMFKIQLSELYVDTGENAKAFETLEKLIIDTDNSNLVRDCVEQLCRIIINTNSSSNNIAIRAYKLITIQQRKYRKFSPKVDNLIKQTDDIIKS
jgi:hypothetical protein